jgi:membrane protease YdiL (CAAX protease family)
MNLAEGLTWFEQVGRATAVALAMLVATVFFVVAHAGNPNATLASTAGIVVVGLLLAVANYHEALTLARVAA